MSVMSRFLTGAGGLLGSWLVRGWMGSLEYKAAHYDPAADMASPDRLGQNIYVLWHEYLLLPFYLRGNCNTTLLVSRHRDADILSRAAYHLGFELVRGSSGRGGLSAHAGTVAATAHERGGDAGRPTRAAAQSWPQDRSIWRRSWKCRWSSPALVSIVPGE